MSKNKKNINPFTRWIKQHPLADDLLVNKLDEQTDDINNDNVINNSIDESTQLNNLNDKSIDESKINLQDVGSENINSNKDPENFWFDMGTVELLNSTTMYFGCFVDKYNIDMALNLLKQINKHIVIVENEYPHLKGLLKPTIIINSNGGNVIDGLRFFDAIKNNPIPVDTIVQGIAASMGAILLFAGKTKKAYENSIIMIHSLSAGMQGKFQELLDYAAFYTKLQTTLGDIIKNNTKAKKEDVDKFMLGESFLTAKEAFAIGLIDEIIK